MCVENRVRDRPTVYSPRGPGFGMKEGDGGWWGRKAADFMLHLFFVLFLVANPKQVKR